MPVFRLSESIEFPPAELARSDGLLAVGGDLSSQRLIRAYSMGIFPWFSGEEPLLWWSPDPRLVLFPGEIRISRSLSKVIRKGTFRVTMDQAFKEVITACANIRLENAEDTWIGKNMIEAYCSLYELGYAHSVEAWNGDRLVGGLYGVSLGRSFFGESMFAYEANASKAAFAVFVEYLQKLEFDMVDCQVHTDHLVRFGAREIPKSYFLELLGKTLEKPTIGGRWTFDDMGGDASL